MDVLDGRAGPGLKARGTQGKLAGLPPEALMEFEREVPAGKRSSVIAALILDWLGRRNREALRDEIVLGCREMAAEYRSLEQEFHPLEEEVERELSGGSSSG